MPEHRHSRARKADQRAPLLSPNPVFIGLRYLLAKKLGYLAIIGVMLSVGTLIVVMSVFTGFQRQLTSVIRGYLSDLRVQPAAATLYGLDDWRSWRRVVLEADHVEGVAPYIEGAALLRVPGSGRMMHAFFRGVHPEYEPTASEMGNYVIRGDLRDLGRRYSTPDGPLDACFVGEPFFRFEPQDITENPRELVLVTATPDLRRRLARYAVNGIFQTGNYEFDANTVVMSLGNAVKFVDSGGGVSGLNVRLDDYSNAERARRAIAERVAPGVVLASWSTNESPLAVALSGHGGRVAVAGSESVVVWETSAAEPVARLDVSATQVALDRSGQRLAAVTREGRLSILSLPQGEPSSAVELTRASATALALAADGSAAAVGRSDGVVELVRLNGRPETAQLRGHQGPVSLLRFEPGAQRLLSGGSDGRLMLWDVHGGRRHLLLRHGEASPIVAAAFSPGGLTLASATAAGHLAAWDLESGELLTVWPQAVEGLRAVAFAGTSQLVVTADSGGASFWAFDRIGKAALVRLSRRAPFRDGAVKPIAFGAEGHRVACIAPGGHVQVRYTGSGFAITTWEEERRTFLEAVAMEQFLQGLIMSFILVLAGFLIFAIVTTLVYEKRRDIGILNAVGFTRWQICVVFVTCGLAIGVIGGLLGVGGGVLFADNVNAIREFIKLRTGFDPFPPELYYFNEIPVYIGFVTPAVTAAGALLCSLVFSFFPALRAARMDPIEALHHE